MPADIKGKKVESIMLEHENKTYPNATYSFLTQLNNLIIKCFLFITSVHTMNIAYFFYHNNLQKCFVQLQGNVSCYIGKFYNASD